MAHCGDEVADREEDCDGADLRDETCESLEGPSGTLSCSPLCLYETSACRCGNGACESDEDETSCPSDCYGECGNGRCEAIEDQVGCPADCGAVAIVAAVGSEGLDYSCALLSDGTVRCWGHNHVAQLGDGTNEDSNVPILVAPW